jgi:transcriptional regulator with XRE-family HTH domain
MATIYEKIKAIREEKRIKQSEMADKLKIAQNNYGKLERGEIQLTVERLFEIARIFKMKSTEIINYHEIEAEKEEKTKALEDEIKKLSKANDRLLYGSIPKEATDKFSDQVIDKGLKGEGLVYFEYDIDQEEFTGHYQPLKAKIKEEYYRELAQKNIAKDKILFRLKHNKKLK